MLLKHDPVGAFMAHDPVPVETEPKGALSGLTMAIKDIYDVAGYRSGWGNPTRLAEAPVAQDNAACVSALLEEGATFIGKTITDELAFSLNGKNAHYGTPKNTRAPDRIPGGSSSGSASAVAVGLCDFAIGSDTGGSVRAPASYNGLYGIRPTHGRIDISGAMPLAESFDTVGWFARDIAVFGRVGQVLLGEDTTSLPTVPQTIIIEDAFDTLEETRSNALEMALLRISNICGHPVETVRLGDREELLMAFRRCQGVEAWAAHGRWIESRNPDLGPGVRERFEFAGDVRPEDAEAAMKVRGEFTARFEALVGNRVAILPTVPDLAPLISMPHEELETYRNKALSILCYSGLSGLPQINLPLAHVDGIPLGISILGPRGSDRALISLAADICS